ncbi:hypothetical protein V8C86DRAFT_2575032 [Haematococcus lacustris]
MRSSRQPGPRRSPRPSHTGRTAHACPKKSGHVHQRPVVHGHAAPVLVARVDANVGSSTVGRGGSCPCSTAQSPPGRPQQPPHAAIPQQPGEDRQGCLHCIRGQLVKGPKCVTAQLARPCCSWDPSCCCLSCCPRPHALVHQPPEHGSSHAAVRLHAVLLVIIHHGLAALLVTLLAILLIVLLIKAMHAVCAPPSLLHHVPFLVLLLLVLIIFRLLVPIYLLALLALLIHHTIQVTQGGCAMHVGHDVMGVMGMPQHVLVTTTVLILVILILLGVHVIAIRADVAPRLIILILHVLPLPAALTAARGAVCVTVAAVQAQVITVTGAVLHHMEQATSGHGDGHRILHGPCQRACHHVGHLLAIIAAVLLEAVAVPHALILLHMRNVPNVLPPPLLLLRSLFALVLVIALIAVIITLVLILVILVVLCGDGKQGRGCAALAGAVMRGTVFGPQSSHSPRSRQSSRSSGRSARPALPHGSVVHLHSHAAPCCSSLGGVQPHAQT